MGRFRQVSRAGSAGVITVALLWFAAVPARADMCEAEIRRNNVVGNALFTVLFRSVNGELNNWRDLAESLAYGASAGYLHYQSRVMIGEGDESRGLATAYLASSITENTTHGYHPLAYLRYGVGPIELKWASPFARQPASRLRFGLNTVDAVGIAAAALSGKAENFELRNGVLTADDNGYVEGDFSAVALGRSVITKPEFADDQGLWHHELIHTTQYLQFSSFGSNSLQLFESDNDPLRVGKLRSATQGMNLDLRIEWFNLLINQLDRSRPYEDRWMEQEAARLAQHTSPMHDESHTNCSAQVGFEFRF